MFFDVIRRPAAAAGLVAAMTFVVPVGTASAATHPGPTAITITPTFAAQLAGGTSQAGASNGIELAQQSRRKIRRDARKRQKRAVNRTRRRTANRVRRNTAQRVRRNEARRVARRNRIYRNGRWWYYRNGGYYDNSGAALAAGVIGLAAGAIAGAAIAGANQPTVVYEEPAYAAPYTAEWYRQCDIKYRSFRASDGTFLGYDGVRRVCTLP